MQGTTGYTVESVSAIGGLLLLSAACFNADYSSRLLGRVTFGGIRRFFPFLLLDPFFLLRKQAVDFRNQFKQFMWILFDCCLFAELAPTFSDFTLQSSYPRLCMYSIRYKCPVQAQTKLDGVWRE